jgi:tetratricopeptide (TPR) repeat protein
MLRKLFGIQSKGNVPIPKNKPGVPDLMGSSKTEPISNPSQLERAFDYKDEQRAFEKVQAAEAAATDGNRVLAERLFREAIELDRHVRAEAGSGYALGRYGAFLQEDGRPAEAIRAYEEAVRLGTDIPAVYGPLMALYAERNEEDALFRTADAYIQRPRIERRRVAEHLIRLAVGRAKAGDAVTAERWLLRTEGWAMRSGDQTSRFSAWGQRGLIIERAGNADRAVACYEAAVAAGTTDRTTFTRLLMAYEKSKLWADAIALAQRALGVQHDATWEEDLRKRIARIEDKLTPTNVRKPAVKSVIPPYSIRLGSDRVSLLTQVSPKLPPRRIALSSNGQRLLVSAASSKQDNLALFDLATLELIWTKSVPGSSAQVLTLGPDSFVAATDHGRVGDGGARLSWLDTSGRVKATEDLPDKLTEVRTAGDLLVAGCRDGHLYAFDNRGRQRWRYRVPGRGDLTSDQPYMRPCPYFVQVSHDGKRILFSSWDTVFLLDDRGKLQWTWTTPTEPRRFHYTVPLDSRVGGETYYRALGLSSSASTDEVRKAFRTRAMETHPDRNPGNPNASDRFREAVQAYEAILSGSAATGAAVGSLTLEFSMAGGMTTIYGLAMARTGEPYLVTGSDGALTTLDARGRTVRRLVASEGAGHLAVTPDHSRIVYAHWGGLNFYKSHGLVGVYPTERLNQLQLAPDGRHVAAWNDKSFLLLAMDGEIVTKLEFARTVTDVAFVGADELIVAAGKLVRLGIR